MTRKQAVNYLKSSGFSDEQIRTIEDAFINELSKTTISRQAVIDRLYDWSNHSMTDAETWHLRQVIGDIKSFNEESVEDAKAHYDEGYKDGYEKGINEVMTIDIFEGIKLAKYNKGYGAGYKEAYQKGLKHGQELRIKETECAEACGMKRAWNVARKIVDLCSELTQEELGEIFGSFDVNDILNGLSAFEAVEKIEAWEKKQEQTEKQEERVCRTCKYLERDIDVYPCSECYDFGFGLWESKEQKQTENDVKVGDTVRTLKDHDEMGNKLFPIGTIGKIEYINEELEIPYRIRANNDYWYYSRDMFEVIKEDAPDINDGSIEVGDEVWYGNPKFNYVVTNIYDGDAFYITKLGFVGRCEISKLHKTGNHYNIQNILDQMKEHEVKE